MLESLRFNSRQVALISTFIAIGAVIRIVIDQVGDMIPTPAFSVIIKLGLTETLTFVGGFVYGPVAGFVTGFSIVLLSDVVSPSGPGAWTPWIGSIIGLLGIIAGFFRRAYHRPPTVSMMIICAVALTLLSEFLQNLWVSLTFSVPLVWTMWLGLPSLVSAMANNVVLFPTVGINAIQFVQRHHLNDTQRPAGRLPSGAE